MVELPENLGIPGGRNEGVRVLREAHAADLVVVLDDDGLLPRTDTLRLVSDAFAENPRLGIVSFRIADENGLSQRRHVPRLGGAEPLKSGPVTTYPGGGHAIRTTLFDPIGDFPGLAAWWAGFFEGVRRPCPPRRPISWRTVWRMTRLGRPPVI